MTNDQIEVAAATIVAANMFISDTPSLRKVVAGASASDAEAIAKAIVNRLASDQSAVDRIEKAIAEAKLEPVC